MLKSILLSAFGCIVLSYASAQTLTIPQGIAQAYSNGTRTLSGKPGKKYWENHARYTINMSIAPPNRMINGVEDITYFNNSPDKLDSLNIKLIENVHNAAGRRGAVADTAAGVKVDVIQINGAKVAWDNSTATTTNQMVGLAKPLMPHDSVKLHISWHYQLSLREGREGVLDSTSFYLAYFYPRVAVYDDYKGWDTQPHTGGLEFYNDFSDYKLSVTVPKNYIVWSTGILRNPNQVLQPVFAKKLQESMTSDSTIHIATPQDLAAKDITTQNETNTWIWTATNITDVAFAVSNRYDWDAASVVVDDQTHRRVSVQAAFDDKSNDFHHYVQFARNSLDWFSHNLPGVPYPFPKTTSVQGFADMEYPMMVNDSHETDLKFAQLVQDHEIAHTYFPFYMGTNESYYAFMDEGWATTFEILIGTAERGKAAADEFYKKFRVNRWTHGPHDKEMPIITPSPQTTFNAGDNFYGKPSLSYLALKDMLGDELFKKALHNYMNNWNGKHPIPWDYFYSMQEGSGKKLDWFFYNWFYTPYYIDLDLEKVEKASNGYDLSIKNIGGFAVPFDAILIYADGTTETIHQTPIVWEKNQKDIVVKIKTPKEVKSITIDGGIFVDADMKNNTWAAN
ncbi:M1 family metallopeptidase [Mucilaginibacter sp.]